MTDYRDRRKTECCKGTNINGDRKNDRDVSISNGDFGKGRAENLENTDSSLFL